VNVHQLIAGAGPVDAVTNQGLAWRRRFTEWGWGGGDFAEEISPGMERHAVRFIKHFKPEPGDRVLIHYSGFARGLEAALDGPSRTLVLSHNITPADYFWAHEPLAAVRCSLAPEQLLRMARAADVAAGVSQFNADELAAGGVADPDVIPILFDRTKLPAVADPGARPDGPPTILFVGRLAPHKRQDLVIRAFALYRRLHAPDARLVLVGMPIHPEYEARMRAFAEEVAPGAVTFAIGVPTAELHAHFAAAHAFLCLSEHEGFCIPLLEAFHFGIPVLARRAGGVPEVAGDAGLILEPEDSLGVVAELLHVVVGDAPLRRELATRAAARLAAYDAETVAAKMRNRLEGLV
jgi:glycosyltransferase involved in cell wall biosynthesis